MVGISSRELVACMIAFFLMLVIPTLIYILILSPFLLASSLATKSFTSVSIVLAIFLSTVWALRLLVRWVRT